MSYLEDHKEEIFKKYTKEELIGDIDNYINGNGKLNKVLNQFFEECIFECCGKKTKISPMEVLKDDDKMKIILEYISNKPIFFKSDSEVANVKSCFRNSMSWVRKVANFPAREARDIYFRYFPDYKTMDSNLNILDTSCGFGSRMSSVLLSGHNYYGLDPNLNLQQKLFECARFYYDNGFINEKQNCILYEIGSENLIEEFLNIMDVSFTSPPYFNLEKYSNDNSQSTNNYDNYNNWVKNFVNPTVENIYKYLKVGGYAMINIKNINKKETCYDDFYKKFSSIEGFEYVETFDLKISKKQYGLQYGNTKGEIKNFEPVMSFRKVK